MLSDFVRCLLLFPLVTFGLGWPLAARLSAEPAEKLCASVVLSLLATYLAAFGVYVFALPLAAFLCLPMAAAVGLILERNSLSHLFADPDVRSLLVGQFLVTAWCVGLLLLVVFYSGGGWVGDWYEHWERTQFFTGRWPLESKFLGAYLLPARPPLANLVTGALIAPIGVTFPNYQVVTTLLNCLAFLPAALLARRFHFRTVGAGNAAPVIAVLTVLVMVNPSFVENATFAWTKLIAACFILSGLYFFLRAHDPQPPDSRNARESSLLCGACLAAGMIAHYSAGPFVVVLVIAWLALNFRRWKEPAYWRLTALTGVVAAFILATWFAWSLEKFGLAATVASNSSAAVEPEWRDHQWLKIALNLRDTVVPHFLRTLDPELITQTSRWGYLRDWWFQLYQVNLLFVFGSVAWVALLADLLRRRREAAARDRRFWIFFVLGVVLLGIAVHGARDHWGLAHICLQALVVLGISYLAARWSSLGRGWRRLIIGGAVVDVVLGIALEFGVESNVVVRWTPPDAVVAERIATFAATAKMNFLAKLLNRLSFVSDAATIPPGMTVVFVIVVLWLALARIRAVRPRA
ncbi:MAG: hypothetical protein JWM35_2643 [Verrucomicrobia bacterium]|nr:hypothetical protein [Verrucomicrobiota bacterium]